MSQAVTTKRQLPPYTACDQGDHIVRTLSLFALLAPGVALADINVKNVDSASYKILLADSNSCFSGTHTSLGGNNSTDMTGSYEFMCINEEKPAYPIADGRSYEIKDGKLTEK